MARRIALALTVLAAVAAPLPAQGSGASGLYGQVRRGPITPVCAVGVPCDAPAPGVTLVFSRAGREVERTVTRQDGTYRIRLHPGLYRVGRLGRRTVGRGLEPRTVRVLPGRLLRQNFSIDTGIR